MFILILKTRYWTDDKESIQFHSLINVNAYIFFLNLNCILKFACKYE